VTLTTRSERPHRRVTSFVRRSSRMTPAQRRAWESYRDRWVLQVPRAETSTSVAPGSTLDLAGVFGRRAPVVVEIGPGMGDSLAPMAAARLDRDILAFEVFEPAIAALLARLATDDIGNVRIASVDAVDGFAHLLAPDTVDEVWMFFPDPWHKARHHKRRLLSPRFADLVATRLRAGGRWRLATDWPDYAAQIRDVLDHHPDFESDHPGQIAPRWPERPVTRFEQRGIEAGRTIADFCYRRRESRL
jgi:tRNA (guanine-N7-)-methyltransferase